MPDFVIKVGIAKKIGMPNYGSFGAECAFDVHLDLGVLADNERFSNTIREAYKKCMDAVEEQIRAVSGSPKPESRPVPHVPESPQVLRPLMPQSPQPALTTQPATSPSPFGAWIKSKADSYGVALPLMTSALYKAVCPQGTATDFIGQGREMAAVWSATNGHAQQHFEASLNRAFESLGKV